MIFLLVFFFVWLPVMLFKPSYAKYTTQAQVIKERIISDGDGADNHIISFKFPDGLVKEFSLSSMAAASIQKRNTGILTYKESKRVEKVKQDKQWNKRLFISFEKYE